MHLSLPAPLPPQMLYQATQPPPGSGAAPGSGKHLALVQLLPHAAGDHLLPQGHALALRRAREAVQRLLVAVGAGQWVYRLYSQTC